MDNYTALVSKVLGNEHLAKAVDDLVDDQCLNLVNPEWLDRLENNITYQDFLTPTKQLWKKTTSTANYDYEDSKVSNFQVVLVGYCKLGGPYKGKTVNPHLIVMNSEPLSKIARAMTSDLGTHLQISSDFKFSFGPCSVMSCSDCRHYAKVFREAGYKINELCQPCIADTRIYDGKCVVNRFYSQFEAMFKKPFVGILQVDINNRYSFKGANKEKIHRVSGVIVNFIGFPESKLTLSKKVDVGPLVPFECSPQNILPNCNNNTQDTVVESNLIIKDNDLDDLEDFVENEEPHATKEGKRKAPEDIVEGEKETKKAKLINDDFEDFMTNEESQKGKLADNGCEIDELQLI